MHKITTLALAAYAVWAAKEVRQARQRELIARAEADALRQPSPKRVVTLQVDRVPTSVSIGGVPATSSDAISLIRESARRSGRLA